MLSYIRNSTIGIILAFVFMLSLFFFKSGGRFSGVMGVGANDVAVVQDIKISNLQFLRTFDLTKQQFKQMLGQDLTNEEAISIGLDKQALSILINEAIFLNEYNEKELFIDDTILAKITKKYIPSIYDNNVINEQKLNIFLSNQNLNLKELLKLINAQVQKDIYENSLFNNINYPNSSSEMINTYDNHLRKIKYLIMPIKNLNFSIINNEKLTKKFYENNINLFMEPEKRNIQYIYINPDNYNSLWNFDNNQLFEYYNNNKIEFTKNEKRKFVQFNFNREENAKNFLKEINNLKNVNKIISIAKKNNIKLKENDFKNENEILFEISKELFNIEKNNISKIISSPIAFHIVFLQDIIPKKIESFESVKKNINKKLKKIQSNEYIQKLLEDLDEDILNGLNLNEISNKHDLTIVNLNYAINSENSEYNLLEKKIVKQAFNEGINTTSDLFDGFQYGSYFLFNVSNIKTSEPAKYELIKNDVVKKWKENEIKIKVDNFLNSISKQKNITQLSEQYNLELLKTEIKKSNSEFPRNFIENIFKSEINDLSFYYTKDAIYIAKTESLKIIPANDLIEERINLDGTINLEVKNVMLEEISNKYTVKINNNLINSLISGI